MQLHEISYQTEWDRLVKAHPDGHPLQLWAWGATKLANGWRPVRLYSQDDNEGAQVLIWKLPRTAWTIAYVPRGPLGRSPELLNALEEYARMQQAVYLRLEPAWGGSVGIPQGWRLSQDNILLPQTYTIDLASSEETLLAAMRPKTRQYIRKAEAAGISVEAATLADFDAVWEIYQSTAKRAEFGLHSADYYRRLWEEGSDANTVLLARLGGQPVAFLWTLAAGTVAFELYGGVLPEGAEAKANYLLKWTMIQRMQTDGYKLYDFNGRLNDGVSQFKAGFGPNEANWVGTLDRPLHPVLYAGWQASWPLIKRLGRKLQVGG